MKIIPFSEQHIPAVARFSDKEFGAGYWTEDSLAESLKLSSPEASLILIDEDEKTQGFRLTYAPGTWMQDPLIAKGLSKGQWKTPPEKVAYFKTILVSPNLRGSGWGQKLSQTSFEALKKAGAEAVLCDSWKESPRNSSQKYLYKLGFEKVAEYKEFWKAVDYSCSRCGRPCLCTAAEMIKYLY